MKNVLVTSGLCLSVLLLSACNSDDKDINSLTTQTTLIGGDNHCWMGGTRTDSGLDNNDNGKLDSNEVVDSSYACNADLFTDKAVHLPFTVLRDDLDNGAMPGTKFEIRNGGYGSDAAPNPNIPIQFYALTDRGPNADYSGSLGKGKMFPTPDYTPRIGLFELQTNGTITKVKDILFKRPDGSLITGLPNSSSLGGTGEIPYDAAGEVIRQDMSQPYNAQTNPIKLDDYGLDSEGLAAMDDGSFWVSDEYGPHIVHYSAEGVEIARINPFADDARNLYSLPAEFAHRRANRGMEGLTITPDQSTLVGIMQSTISNPDKSVNNNTLTRIVTINLATGAISQYLYQQEIAQNSNSAIVALSNSQFLVLERDGKFFNIDTDVMKHVYKIDISGATDLETVTAQADIAQDAALGLTIKGKTLEQVALSDGWEALAANGIIPATKSLVLDMAAKTQYPHDKMEGLWLIDNKRLGVLNDDDFATWSNNNTLEQKYLDSAQSDIDGNTLYIVDDLPLSADK
ncbi:esterase-like activity of phytase family protein [Shewanella sp. SP1S1-7]|uniref:esterase-like activity of phytase family protein n=1 Tax=Shewanella sp. SP1S1-7 TaxID=3063536 RepID=UPI00288D83CC|nr:esterase-like activity of phytase family protein [Shewanella sp. SP1S1-7]MDT3337545.1 esterase-like activity of phytase family protein [Shewanella sp. SP1S1-7]